MLLGFESISPSSFFYYATFQSYVCSQSIEPTSPHLHALRILYFYCEFSCPFRRPKQKKYHDSLTFRALRVRTYVNNPRSQLIATPRLSKDYSSNLLYSSRRSLTPRNVSFTQKRTEPSTHYPQLPAYTNLQRQQ